MSGWKYLGVRPPNDALGVLQDMHWAVGAIGYFSTYALGNVVSGQLWEEAERGPPDLRRRSSKASSARSRSGSASGSGGTGASSCRANWSSGSRAAGSTPSRTCSI